jgi:hypothetical protein
MADYGGWKAKAAFKKDRGLYGAGPAIAYPQVPGATDMAGTHQFAFMSENLKTLRERAPDESLVGSGSQLPPDIFRKMGAGPIQGVFRWRGLERLIMCAMGFESAAGSGTGSPETLEAGAYRHLFEMDFNLVDEPWTSVDERAAGFNSNDRKVRRGQLGLGKGLDDWVQYSAFVNKMTITGTPAEGVRFAFELLTYDRVRGSYNSTNWTLPAGPITRILFHQCQIRLGLRAAGQSGTVDVFTNKFELEVDNKMSAEDQSSATGQNIEIPVRTEASTVMLKLERPRYTDRGTGDPTWIGLLETDQEMCARIVMTGASIGATAQVYRWGFFMTSLKQSPDSAEPNIQGPGPLRNSFALQAFSRDPASTDEFAASYYGAIALKKASPLVVTCANADSGNYLLET